MNKWEKQVQQSLLKDEQGVLRILRQMYAAVLREAQDRSAVFSARIAADPADTAAVYQLRYQKALEKQLEDILQGFAEENFTAIQDYLDRCYTNGFTGAMYSIHRQGIPVITPIDQENVVRAVTLDSKISVPMYTRLGNNIAQLKTAIAAEVTRGIASGAAWHDTAARIADSGNVSAGNAMRIARTEGHRIACEAQMDACRAAAEAGADIVKQWDSTMDGRTRQHHKDLHGQIRTLEEPFEISGRKAQYPGAFGRPEEDIHCRCALLQRARWALSDAQLQALRETDAAKELASASGFEDFKGKYLEMLDKSAESGIMKLRTDESDKHRGDSFSDRGIRLPDSVQRNLSELLEKDDYITGDSNSFTETDVSVMAKETGVEFARISIGDKSYLVRGDAGGTSIPQAIMKQLAQGSGSLDFHAHPYDDDLIPSMADRNVISMLEQMTGQRESRIITPNGKTSTFGKNGIISVDTVRSEIDEERAKALLELFGGE